MALTPAKAKEIVESKKGFNIKPIFAERGKSKGIDHVDKTYRFEFGNQEVSDLIRHIAINREIKNDITVYVNKFSIIGSEYPSSSFSSIKKADYPKGFTGKTGYPGIASSVARLSTLNPKYNDVLRLSVSTEEEFNELLNWYLGSNTSVSVEKIYSEEKRTETPLSKNDSSSVITTISHSEQNKLDLDAINLSTDEREAIVKVRYGQGSFRDALIKINGEKCWMTVLEGKRLLIASHIKPWSHCEESRGKINNGLLLSALWDSAFDSGLISFDEHWNVVTSNELTESAKAVLNINHFKKLPEIFRNDERGKFLSYHREHVFEKWNKKN